MPRWNGPYVKCPVCGKPRPDIEDRYVCRACWTGALSTLVLKMALAGGLEPDYGVAERAKLAEGDPLAERIPCEPPARTTVDPAERRAQNRQRILDHLAANPTKNFTTTELDKALKLKKGTSSPIIYALSAEKLIKLIEPTSVGRHRRAFPYQIA